MKKQKNSSPDQITNFENINKNQKQIKLMQESSMKSKITSALNQQTKKYELNIRGEVYESEVANNFTVPLSVVEDLHINDFPLNITLNIVMDDTTKFNDRVLIIPRIKNSIGKTTSVEFNYCPEVNSVVHSAIGFPLKQELIAELLLSNTKFKPEIISNTFEIDTFHFTCSISIPKDKVGKMYYTVMEYYYSARWKVGDEGNLALDILRKKLGLPETSNPKAKLTAIIDNANPYDWVEKDGFFVRAEIK
jgi:hypothetical protein